jgi:DNA-binding MarR family transcriptional regulator
MPELENELQILQEIERNPDLTQAGLAVQLGVAVGSVNWYLKRLIGKGYVKVTHLQRRKLRYFLTPSGLALKVKLTRSYMDVSLRMYRELRLAAQGALGQVRQAGHSALYVEGQSEALDILRLTCLEQGLQIAKAPGGVPVITDDGLSFAIAWPDGDGGEGRQS